MDIGFVLDVGFAGYVCRFSNPTCIVKMLIMRKQSDSVATFDRPFETDPGLCAHDPFYQLDYYNPLYASFSEYSCVVGAADWVCRFDVWIGDMGLSVEGAETHDVWRQHD